MTLKIGPSVIIAAAALMVAPLAYAQSELELISGATTVVVTTGTPIVYTGTVGAWTLNVSTGTLLGSLGLDLTSVNASSSGTSTPLEILWSSSFASTAGSYLASVGGTFNDAPPMTDTFSSYYGSSLLTTANPLTAALTFTANPFSGSDTGTSPGGTFLTEEALLSGATTPGSQTSFDFSLVGTPAMTSIPDGGMTLALLGCAMAGMTLIRTRTGKQK